MTVLVEMINYSIMDAYFATVEENIKVLPLCIYFGKKPVGLILLHMAFYD